MEDFIRAAAKTYLVTLAILIAVHVTIGPIDHRLTYGYWFPHFRPMTRADIECVPPSTVQIKIGEYTDLPEAVIDWCGFRDQYEGNVTFLGHGYSTQIQQ